MKTLTNMKIRERTFISYFVIILIPVIAIGFAASVFSASILKDQTVFLTSKVIDQIDKNIQYNFDDMNLLINNINIYKYNNQYLTSILEDTELNSSLNKNDDLQAGYNEFFGQIFFFCDDIRGVYIYENNNVVYSNYRTSPQGKRVVPYEFEKQKIGEDKNKMYIIGTHKEYDDCYSENVFSLYKHLYYKNMDSDLGIISVDFGLDSLRDICKNTNLKLGEKIIICDSKGRTIYNTDESKLHDTVSSDLMKYSNKGKRNVNNIKYMGDNYLLVSQVGDKTDYRVFFLIPKDNIAKQGNSLTIIIIIISLISMIIAVFVAGRLSKAITHPIKKLSESIKEAEHGNLNIQVAVEREDEIGELAKNYNSMINKIRYMIYNEYKLNLIKKEAQLKALVQQINPHFLYNTLEIISGAAIENNVPKISKISVALGQMFRYNIKTEGDEVLLSEEIKHVENYIKIYSYRFEDNLEVIYDIEEQCKKIKALKLLLQPLVENSIKHGIEKQGIKFRIIIKAYCNKEDMIIEVIDDGKGIAKEKLSHIERTLQLDGASSIWKIEENQSIGLRNVNARLFLYYGEEYKLKIDSHQNKGTTIIIRIPIHKEENKQ